MVKTWKESVIEGTASYKIAYKLKRLKNEIKKWTKEEDFKEESKIECIMANVEALDSKEANFCLTDKERRRERGCVWRLDLD